MPYLFSYTECEAPGPFQSKAGFKVKSLSSLLPHPADADLERLINVTVANFPTYQAPRVDAYLSAEEFKSLPKIWSYIPVIDGYFAFMRLATSGTKMGRPGNPFHQALLIKFQDVQLLVEHANRKGLENLTPADLYLWNWPNPRGDVEVEKEIYDAQALPIPEINEIEMSETWERIISEPSALNSSRQFESRFLSSSPRSLDLPEKDYFSLLSLLLRLIPLEYSWSCPFSNLPETMLPRDFDPQLFPAISRSQEKLLELSHQSVFWAELVELIVESGFQLEAIKSVQEISRLFNYSLRAHRQALLFLPLAILVMNDSSGILDEQGLRSAAWQVLQDIALKPDLKNEVSKKLFIENYISKLNFKLMPPAAEVWLHAIEVRQ